MTVNLTLRVKLLSLAVILLAGFSIAISIYLKTRFAQTLSEELLKRGESIVRHFAEICTEPFIKQDFLQLGILAKEHAAAEKDISYILILNQDNKVIAHSFADGYPLDLKQIRHVSKAGEPSIRQVDFGGTQLYDISAPVLDTRIGSVRIGISAQPVNDAVDAMIGRILGTILLFGLVALIISLPVLKRVIQPVSALTDAVKQLEQGSLQRPLKVTSNDELGLLTNSFNSMAATIKKTEQQLATQVEFLQILIDDIPLPVFYKDLQSVMLGCNHAYSNFWGKPKQEIVGVNTYDLYPPVDAEIHLQKDQELLEEKSSVIYKHCVTNAKGQERHILFNKALFADDKGQPAGIIGVMQDITEQRLADQMKNEFVATVAHEFQTPLATILGYTELLQENVLGGEARDEALEMITRKTEALSEMVDELLDLARIETSKGLKVNLEPRKVKEALGELVNNFIKRTTSHIVLLELPEQDIVVAADKVRMGQVMENLLSNAVKYSDKHSTIQVRVSGTGTHCQVEVCDQGIGMTERQATRIFEKYYRIDTSNTAPPGTGLGLYITKSIIDAHNGQIEVFSTPGKGTTVMFRLPVLAEQSA